MKIPESIRIGGGSEYIEREAIKYEQWSVGPLCEPLMVVRKKTIDALPAADVAHVVHGRWENITIAVVDTTGYCGVCGEQAVWRSRNKPYAICPNCGAKMDATDINVGDKEEE